MPTHVWCCAAHNDRTYDASRGTIRPYHDTGPGSTPLHLAARSGASSSVLELLLAHGAPLEARNRHGATALITASAGGHAMACELLLRAGARAQARDAHGRTASW